MVVQKSLIESINSVFNEKDWMPVIDEYILTWALNLTEEDIRKAAERLYKKGIKTIFE